MDVDELKKLVRNGMSVLVMDNGEPSFAILSYDSYKDLVLNEQKKDVKISHSNGEANSTSSGFVPLAEKLANSPIIQRGELEVLDRINKEILALKDEIEKEEKNMSGEM